MQDKLPIIYILCGLTNEDSEEFKAELSKTAKESGYETVCVSRYRKEGIRQYIYEHPEFRTLVLQEAMQPNYPYEAEELSELMDNYHLNIIISIRKVHRGSGYMKTLYTAGVLNALYEEDATAQNVLKRILFPRTRGECRRYYQIKNARDAESALDIVDEARMSQYISYIEDADCQDEMAKRYRFIANELKVVENMYLARELSSYAKKALEEDGFFQEISGFSAKKDKFKCLLCRGGVPVVFHPTKKVKKMDEERMPALLMEQTVKEYSKKEVEKMVDEDISDLLGFSTTGRYKEMESEMNYHNEENINSAVVVPDAKTTCNMRKKMSKWVAVILGLVILVIIFAVWILVLLFA